MSGTSKSGTVVRAAGGAVWRVRDGVLEVALVHRPHYDDWSLPKGKLHRGEAPVPGAVREVAEEVGSRVAVSRRLPTVTYRLPADGADKTVSFWAMRHVDGAFAASDEVDEVRWLAVPDAREAVTFPTDRAVLDDLVAQPLPDAVVVLVRHARAGKRSEWSGPDEQRPLDPVGRAQAERLVAFLGAFTPQRLLSAEPLRCVQTVGPFAAHSGLDVVVDERLGDEGYTRDPAAAVAALRDLTAPGGVTVVSSQGSAIPGLVPALVPDVASAETKKAGAWVLSFAGGAPVAADYYAHAGR